MCQHRPIQFSGWAFQLQRPIPLWAELQAGSVWASMGCLMVFGHLHGVNPSAEKIAMHHAMMGTTAATAGSSKLLSGWFRSPLHVRSPA